MQVYSTQFRLDKIQAQKIHTLSVVDTKTEDSIGYNLVSLSIQLNSSSITDTFITTTTWRMASAQSVYINFVYISYPSLL